MDLSHYTFSELLKLQAEIFLELRSRNIIRTKNVKGDIGEYVTVEFFNSRKDLPNLVLSKAGTKNVDAVDNLQQSYSIKTITSTSTSCFYGLEPPESTKDDIKKFDFLIITELNDDWSLKRILRLSWDLFLKYKSWHSAMSGWKITLNKAIASEADLLYN
jgi:hypothetical protein